MPLATPDAVVDYSMEKKVALLEVLQRRFPDLGLCPETFRVLSSDTSGLMFEDTGAGVKGSVDAPDARNGYWGGTVRIRRAGGNGIGYEVEDAFIGNLLSDVPFRGPVCELHKDVPTRAEQFVFNHNEENHAVLRSVTPNVEATITMLRPAKTDSCCILSRPGERDCTIAAKGKVNHLKSRVCEAFARHDTMKLILVNNSIVESEASKVRSDDVLVRLIMERRPDVTSRLRFSPDAKSSNCNGIYYCNPLNNVWCQTHNAVLEELLIRLFDDMGETVISRAELKHVQGRRGGADLLRVLARKCASKDFAARLDANLDVLLSTTGCLTARMPDGLSFGKRRRKTWWGRLPDGHTTPRSLQLTVRRLRSSWLKSCPCTRSERSSWLTLRACSPVDARPRSC